jgi:pimeloyl-ACP methyl ester carboxylesterase
VVPTDDGARLAVSVIGTDSGRLGAPVVLTHGWGGSRAVWDAVVARLTAAGHPVITFDLRGHGDSTLGTAPVSLARLADDLAAVLDHVDARDVVLGGHSGGGYVALAYAVARPSEAVIRLRGLALLATASHEQDTPASELRMFGNPVFNWVINRPFLGRKLLGQMVGPRARDGVAEANRRLFASLAPKVRVDYFRISCGMDLRHGLASVAIPAVVVAGTEDKIIEPVYGERLAAALPDARFTGLDGIGHMLPLEAPVAVAEALIGLAR